MTPFDIIKREIQERINSKKAFVTETVCDQATYARMVGEIRGLIEAQDVVKDSERKYEEA